MHDSLLSAIEFYVMWGKNTPDILATSSVCFSVANFDK